MEMEQKKQQVKKFGVMMPSRWTNHSKNKAKRSPDYEKLVEKNLSTEIVDKLDDLFKSGKLNFDELEDNVFSILSRSPPEVVSAVLDQFKEANYTRKSVKSALLCSMVEVQNLKQFFTPSNSTASSSSEESEMSRSETEAALDRSVGSYSVGRDAELNPYATEFVPSSASEGGSTDTDFEHYNYMGNQTDREEGDAWMPETPDSSDFQPQYHPTSSAVDFDLSSRPEFEPRNQRPRLYRTLRNVPYSYAAPCQYALPPPAPCHQHPASPYQIAVPSQYMSGYRHIGTGATSPQTPEVHVFLSNYYLG